MVNKKITIDLSNSNTITFNWKEKKTSDKGRVGAMYCFKRCDINQN